MSDIAKDLWCKLIVEGVKAASGAHRPYDMCAAVQNADEMVRRYFDRFEPDADTEAMERVMAESLEADRAERAKFFDDQKAAAEAERMKHGPWKQGETLYVKSRGHKAVEVIEEMGKPKVTVRLDGRRVEIHRDDLTGVLPTGGRVAETPLEVVQ